MSKIYETCYVYKIINDIDDLVYIGSTADKLCKRMAKHRETAKREDAQKRKIYIHMNLHGIEHFKIILVEEYKNINREELLKNEDKFIKEFDSIKIGLNGRLSTGNSICEHNKRRVQCKECGGSQICEHNNRRSQCKECGGSQICEHNKMKNRCKECGGSSICEHNKEKGSCKDCTNFICNICDKKLCSNHSLKRHLITCSKNQTNTNNI